jgi:hypothetical protein
VSAGALKTLPASDPQDHQTTTAKFVDDASARQTKALFVLPSGREFIGGISAPIGVDSTVRDLLERRGRLAKESAEQRAIRRQPVKEPWTEAKKAAVRIKRAAAVQAAYEAVGAWSLRPKMPNWRVRERWTPEQHESFAAEFEAFAKRVPQPTERQIELVGKDYAKLERIWHTAPDEMEIEPGREPWALGKNYARDRFRNGYRGTPDGLAGRKYPIGYEYSESYLRSMLSHVLFSTFVLGTPKGGRRRFNDDTALQSLSAGPAKEDRRPYWSKLEGLDQPYITLLSKFRCAWRVELDRDFESFDELKALLWEMVCRGELACLPHVVVGAIDPVTKKLQHPHLWFCLSEKNRVLYDRANPKASTDAMDLYDGVVAGTFAALEHLGADMGAASSPIDGKNPLCPQWSMQVWNEDTFPSLQQWSMHVRIWHRLGHLVREQAIANSSLAPGQSNDVFHRASAMAWAILRGVHMSGDALYRELLHDRRALADRLFEALLVEFRDEPNQRKCIGTLRRVARYVAGKWDPHALEPSRNRGEAYDLVRGIRHRDTDGIVIDEAVTKRKSIGGKFARAKVKAQTVNLMVETMKDMTAFGVEPSLAHVKKRLRDKRNPKTISNNWSLAVSTFRSGSALELRCLLGSLGSPGEIQEPALLPSVQSESARPMPETIISAWPGGHNGDPSIGRM